MMHKCQLAGRRAEKGEAVKVLTVVQRTGGLAVLVCVGGGGWVGDGVWVLGEGVMS